MSTELINLNPDLKKLRDDGYNIEIREGHLLVKDVSYLDDTGAIKRGTLLSPLTLAGDRTAQPERHTVLFTGEYPHSSDGKPLTGIKCGERNKRIVAGLMVCYEFSAHKLDDQGNKVRYKDHYEKMTSYVRRLSHPAASVDPGATAQTYRVLEPVDEDSPFEYLDTASARAGITEMQSKLTECRLGIIGVGGTGSYVLDFVAKTQVLEIQIFDDDLFLSHNAFRAPGAASKAELRAQQHKVEYFRKKYSVQRRRIIAHRERITSENLKLLDVLDFVFICLDSGNGERRNYHALGKIGKTFCRCRHGNYFCERNASGNGAYTTSTVSHRDHIRENSRFSLEGDPVEDEYSSNTQIAELNALNAALAVIRWKKIYGFYLDQLGEHHSVYLIGQNRIVNEDA